MYRRKSRGRKSRGRRHAIDDVLRSTLTRLVCAMNRGRKEWTGVLLSAKTMVMLRTWVCLKIGVIKSGTVLCGTLFKGKF